MLLIYPSASFLDILLTAPPPPTGRKTRSGNEFSPFGLDFSAPPIRVTNGFDMAQELDSAQAKEDDFGLESEDEREVDPPQSTPPTSTPLPQDTPLPPPSAAASTSAAAGSNSQAPTRSQKHFKAARARKRKAAQESGPPELRSIKACALKKRKEMKPIVRPTDAEELPAASTGWKGKNLPSEQRQFTLEEVKQSPWNLTHIQWDGW